MQVKILHPEDWRKCLHKNAYRTSFCGDYCPDWDKNIERRGDKEEEKGAIPSPILQGSKK